MREKFKGCGELNKPICNIGESRRLIELRARFTDKIFNFEGK